MATIHAIDTGAWRVRRVTMEGSFRRFSITDAAEVPLGVDEDGGQSLTPSLAALQSDAPEKQEIERVSALSLENGVIRLVRLPFSDRAAIERAVPAEVEASAPYDLEDMVMAVRVIEAKDNTSRSLACIAHKDAVRSRIDTLTAAGLEPKLLCFDVDALASYADGGVQVVLDVGHNRTLAALCQNRALLSARLIGDAGRGFTEAVAAAGALDFAAAEAKKHTMRVPGAATATAELVSPEPGFATPGSGADPNELELDDETTGRMRRDVLAAAHPDELVQAALITAVDAWIAEVRLALIAMEDQTGLGVDEVLLAGGSSQLRGLPERLGEALGVTVRTVVVPGGYPPGFALSVALARAGAAEIVVEDLRKGEFAFHGDAERMWRWLGYGAFGTAVMGLALVMMAALQISDAQGQLAELDQKLSDVVQKTFADVSAEDVATPTDAMRVMTERSAQATARVELLGGLASGIPPMLDTLKVLSERVPTPGEARIDVRELTVTEESITFKAETDSYETAAKIAESLKRERRFGQAARGEEKKVGEAISFVMTIPLGANAEGEDAAAAPAGEEG